MYTSSLFNDSDFDYVASESALLTLTYDTNITNNGSLVVTDLSGLADQVRKISMFIILEHISYRSPNPIVYLATWYACFLLDLFKVSY